MKAAGTHLAAQNDDHHPTHHDSPECAMSKYGNQEDVPQLRLPYSFAATPGNYPRRPIRIGTEAQQFLRAVLADFSYREYGR